MKLLENIIWIAADILMLAVTISLACIAEDTLQRIYACTMSLILVACIAGFIKQIKGGQQ